MSLVFFVNIKLPQYITRLLNKILNYQNLKLLELLRFQKIYVEIN